ncbi:zinc finger protein JACKDAW-like [Coffea arabica]|uniref:Zinc finger protein JACKDAW-like n=1 Tax=Coffea arabica TaxID=13443 RepID=A0A6P6VX66_COFAR|nr:zinc finger protein GAI-ASSOCIATED FACTOR 1-like [Coffea arabica]
MSNISGDDEPFKNYSASTPTNSDGSSIQQQQAPKDKKKRNPPGNPDPDAEVIALSPKTLMATKRFICEICQKGFQRDQNLQLHRRGHNLPWKLRQRTSTETRKRVYVCPETCCVHHNPSRALGDLTGIKKHYSRKHGEKKWKCDKCSKKYAVQSDWKAHSRTCGTREYKCECGTIFSRRDSFITHRAFCDALAEENSKISQVLAANKGGTNIESPEDLETMSTRTFENKLSTSMAAPDLSHLDGTISMMKTPPNELMQMSMEPSNIAGLTMFSSTLLGSPRNLSFPTSRPQLSTNSPTVLNGYNDSNSKGHQEASIAQFSATALMQKAAQIGSIMRSNISSPMVQKGFTPNMAPLFYNGTLKYLSDTNIFHQRGTEKVSASDQLHDPLSNADESSRMQNLGTNNGLLFNENLDFLHNNEGACDADDGDTTINGRNQAGIYARSLKNSNFMTLDLLGIGGFGHTAFHGMQQQEMDVEAATTVLEDASCIGYVSATDHSTHN